MAKKKYNQNGGLRLGDLLKPERMNKPLGRVVCVDFGKTDGPDVKGLASLAEEIDQNEKIHPAEMEEVLKLSDWVAGVLLCHSIFFRT